MATLLVAEDDPDVRSLLCYALAEGGHRVIAAVDGQDGWEKLQDSAVDAAILDLNMPRMDGLELCRKLRGSPEHRRLPILMLTIKALVEDQVHGYDAGADEYLPKPVETTILLARVKALLARAGKTA